MKVRMKFSKTGSMKFVGHLDVMRYFQKAIRRAEIDIQYSQGFNPHQLMSFASPLGVGLTSDAEYVDLIIGETESSKLSVDKLNETMGDGFKVLNYRQVTDESKNAMSIVAAADYVISLRDGYSWNDKGLSFEDTFIAFYEEEEIHILKKSKKSEREVNIKPFIYCVTFEDERLRTSVVETFENGTKVVLKLSSGSVNNLKPELVMEAFCKFAEVEYNPYAWQIHRLEVYENLAPVAEGETIDLTKLVPLDYETIDIA